MRLLRLGSTVYVGLLLLLFLFPPWTIVPPLYPQRYATRYRQFDPLYRSLGHHWRFRLPYHWGWQTNYCGSQECGGESVWEPNQEAVVDYRLMEYESMLALIVTIFAMLILDPIGKLSSTIVRAVRRARAA